MKNFFARFVPPFLKRLDYHLLLHHRLLWITKIHYVLFYSAVVLGLTYIVTNWFPASPANYFDPIAISVILGLLTLVPFGFWLFKQISFSIETNYGRRSSTTGYAQWILQFLVIALFATVPIIGGIMGQYRVANLVESTDFVQDMNTLNIGNPYFPTSNYRDNIHDHQPNGNSSDYYSYDFTYFSPYPSAYLFGKNLHHSSEVKSIHEVSHCGTIKREQIDNFIITFNKYGGQIDMDTEAILENYYSYKESHHSDHYLKAQKEKVRSHIRDINLAKTSDIFPLDDFTFWTILMVLVFSTSVVLMVFQQSQIRDFIIATISGIGLFLGLIFTSIIANEVFHLGSDGDETFFVISLFVYTVLLIKAASIAQAKTYSRFKTIALILTAVTTPFLFFGLSLLSQSFGTGFFLDERESEFWASFAMYALVFFPFFKALLTRVQALPKG